MKKLYLILAFLLFAGHMLHAQEDKEIRLIIRGDDIGSFHAANTGCMESYRDGIMRSVEIMVPCPWFPEAVHLLNENPGLDVGVHLVMTSEWVNMKWRPLTGRSGITDEDGFFYPMVWPNDNYPPDRTFRESNWKIEEVEKELRAQIEVALANIENVTHISSHMGFGSADPAIDELIDRLSKEYGLDIDLSEYDVQRLGFRRDRSMSYEDQAKAFAEFIMNLSPGTYLFVEHPAKDTPELETIGHEGYNSVGYDREGVTYIFTSDIVKAAIAEKGVKLISYGDLPGLSK